MKRNDWKEIGNTAQGRSERLAERVKINMQKA